MEDLTKALNLLRLEIQQLRKQTEMLTARTQAASMPEYVDADAAAIIVGLPVTKSGSHRNRLTAAYKRGQLTKAIPGRPYLFHRQELADFARRRAAGEVHL
jgi:hypothetical protein